MSITAKLHIPNISCEHCTRTIVRETEGVRGVEKVAADPATKTVTYTVSGENVLAQVKKTLEEIGYPADA